MAAPKCASMAIIALLSFALCSARIPPTSPLPLPRGINGGFDSALDNRSGAGGGSGGGGIFVPGFGIGGFGWGHDQDNFGGIPGTAPGGGGSSSGGIPDRGGGGGGGILFPGFDIWGFGKGFGWGHDQGFFGGGVSGTATRDGGFPSPPANQQMYCVPSNCYDKPEGSGCKNGVNLYFDYGRGKHDNVPVGSHAAAADETKGKSHVAKADAMAPEPPS